MEFIKLLYTLRKDSYSQKEWGLHFRSTHAWQNEMQKACYYLVNAKGMLTHIHGIWILFSVAIYSLLHMD